MRILTICVIIILVTVIVKAIQTHPRPISIGDVSSDLMFYNTKTKKTNYLAGSQAGVVTLNDKFVNLGVSYDANSLYHIYIYNTAQDGTYSFAVLFPDETSVNPVMGASNNIEYRIAPTRQVLVKSTNNGIYLNMQWRMIKVMQF